jgi:hypothetical protein
METMRPSFVTPRVVDQNVHRAEAFYDWPSIAAFVAAKSATSQRTASARTPCPAPARTHFVRFFLVSRLNDGDIRAE